MPKVERKKDVYSYEEFLVMLNERIIEEFDSVTSFLNSKKFLSLGFTEDDKKKVGSYLSIPKKGGKKKVKSLGAIEKVAKGFKIKFESEVEVERRVKITLI